MLSGLSATVAYTYDIANRVTTVSTGSTTGVGGVDYSFDANGNTSTRFRQAQPGGSVDRLLFDGFNSDMRTTCSILRIFPQRDRHFARQDQSCSRERLAGWFDALSRVHNQGRTQDRVFRD